MAGVAWIPQEAEELIGADAVRWGPRETGGPLFGYEACGELVITRAFLPGPNATHLPFLFRPDREAVERAIAEVHRQSRGGERWIGSWHTHPYGRARPSLLDRRTAGKVATELAVGCPRPLMLIQTTRLTLSGTESSQLAGFRWISQEGNLSPLELRCA
jgi:integrative and conjugative element protein (TIGR02256 family)